MPVLSATSRQRVIVVGFDGGLPARRALAWAARRAGAGGRVILTSATPGLDLMAGHALEHARLVLDELTLDGGAPDVEVVVVDDPPSRALTSVARRFSADEIVIGGRAGRGEGDVAADLRVSADRPVVVVR